MEITILRHGETEGNLSGKYVGRSDFPLAPEGIARAENKNHREDVLRVYTSTLRRTYETAGILYPRAEIIKIPGLREMDFGVFENKSWREMESDTQYRSWVDSGCEDACPGGECKTDFILRCRDAFLEIFKKEMEENSPEMHLVVHGGVIMAVMSILASPQRDYFSWKADFCGGYIVDTSASGDERPLSLVRQVN